jgi:hypothetical protein
MRVEVDKYIDHFLKGERMLNLEKTFQMNKNEVAALP